MDWIFTDTALGLGNWLQLEDIYSNVYLLKCARWAEKVNREKIKDRLNEISVVEISNSAKRNPTEINQIWCWWYFVSAVDSIDLVSIIILLVFFIILSPKSTERSECGNKNRWIFGKLEFSVFCFFEFLFVICDSQSIK
jgi:hypothetical protein